MKHEGIRSRPYAVCRIQSLIYRNRFVCGRLVRWNYALSGLDPWSYHAVNVALHAAVSFLFAWLCRHCLGLSKFSSLLAASLFAIHPIHTEAVSQFHFECKKNGSFNTTRLPLLPILILRSTADDYKELK